MSETKPAAKKASGSSEPKPRNASVPQASAKKAAEPKASAQPAAAQGSSVIIKGKAVPTRGRTFVGTVISNRMSKTVTVEWERRKYVPKYQRYEKRRTRVKAHDPFGLKIGDTVEIVETRPISKTKNFLVTKIMNK
jgi:small subunit ribosomal protein S17